MIEIRGAEQARYGPSVRLPKTDDAFSDQILWHAQHGPANAAAYCRKILDSGALPRGISRAELLVDLGEYSQMAGDVAAAGQAFREAVAESGTEVDSGTDPRPYLAEWCLAHGDPEEGRRVLDEVWRSRPRSVHPYISVGELLEEQGDDAGAIKWLTAGALRALRDDGQTLGDVQFILAARRRVRLAQGFDEDDYDVMAEELRDRIHPGFRDIDPA